MIILSTRDRKPWDKQAWGGMRKAADDVLYKGEGDHHDLDVHEDDHVVTYVCATYVMDELMT